MITRLNIKYPSSMLLLDEIPEQWTQFVMELPKQGPSKSVHFGWQKEHGF